jgi:hypothetical protein
MTDQNPPRPSWRATYRDQYRQISSSPVHRAFRIISPVIILLAAVAGESTGYRLS